MATPDATTTSPTLSTREHRGPIVVACGGGTNSAAVLVEFVRRKQRVDLITFSDTKGEKPETYTFVDILSQWCAAHGLPPITILQAVSPRHGFEGLEGMVLRNETLPSKAFGYKSCSQRYKIEPQEKFLNHWEPARTAWAAGQKVLQVIGYDYGEQHRAKDYTHKKCEYWYPLIDWQYLREDCVAAIKQAGLPLPGKSACFFCPSMKPHEVLALASTHPDLYARAVAMEDRALAGGKCTVVKGLGRHWSWREIVEGARKGQPLDVIEPDAIDCACYDGEDEEPSNG